MHPLQAPKNQREDVLNKLSARYFAYYFSYDKLEYSDINASEMISIDQPNPGQHNNKIMKKKDFDRLVLAAKEFSKIPKGFSDILSIQTILVSQVELNIALRANKKKACRRQQKTYDLNESINDQSFCCPCKKQPNTNVRVCIYLFIYKHFWFYLL